MERNEDLEYFMINSDISEELEKDGKLLFWKYKDVFIWMYKDLKKILSLIV